MTGMKTLAMAGLLLAMMFSLSFSYPFFEAEEATQDEEIEDTTRSYNLDPARVCVITQFVTNYTGKMQFFPMNEIGLYQQQEGGKHTNRCSIVMFHYNKLS